MRRLIGALAGCLALGQSVAAQVVGTAPIAHAGGGAPIATAATPVALPALPLPAGARVMALGHSYID